MSTESYIRTSDHLTVVFKDGSTTTVYPSNPQYNNIVAALKAKDYDKVKMLAVPVAAVQAKIAKVTKRTGVKTVELRAGVVYYNDKAIHNSLTDRIVSMANEGFDIEPMCNFLKNLYDNPSYRAVNEFYPFMEKGKLPITEDGHFLAYKRVRNNYTDCHSGTFDNSVGTVVEMPRNQVNEDPKQTCSEGLHFCSRDYLPHFGTDDGNRTVILKINPRDVVAIPVDYNDAKGRTCRYEVIGELEHKNEKPLEGTFRPSDTYKAPVDDFEDEEDFDDEDEDDTERDTDLQTTEVGAATIAASSDEGIEEEFRTVEEAAKWAGTTASAIRRVLKGERKSTAGFRWSYIEVDNTQPHPDHLADLHANGTLKGGLPHNTLLDDLEEQQAAFDEENEDDIPY